MAFIDARNLIERSRWHLHSPADTVGRIEGAALVDTVKNVCVEGFRPDFVRAYLYDGRLEEGHKGRPNQRANHDALEKTPGLRLRVGHAVNRGGQLDQKGVDTLFVLDMLVRAQQDLYDVAVLGSGDRDFAEVARVVADDYGRRVIVWTIDQGSVSEELLKVADAWVAIPVGRVGHIFRWPESRARSVREAPERG